MGSIIAVFMGMAGTGTSTLGTRVASILDCPFASFGSYVRLEAAKRGLGGSREELQNLGGELLKDADRFSREVIRLSGWRPGQPLVVDGVRHLEVLHSLERLTRPTPVVPVLFEAANDLRVELLRDKGEIHSADLQKIDDHPVEQESREVLPKIAEYKITVSSDEEDKADEIVEYLSRRMEIPASQGKIGKGFMVRIPVAIRDALDLKRGDLLEFGDIIPYLVAAKILDEPRMRSAFGRLEAQLRGVDPRELVKMMRNGEFDDASGQDRLD